MLLEALFEEEDAQMVEEEEEEEVESNEEQTPTPPTLRQNHSEPPGTEQFSVRVLFSHSESWQTVLTYVFDGLLYSWAATSVNFHCL